MNKWYIDERSKQSYSYFKAEKPIRNGNRSLQRNKVNLNQPLINRNGYNYLNQSVEGDMLMINSKFSPTNNSRFGYINGEVKRTNSSIKISPENNDVVMPLDSKTKNSKFNAGRMWSTLNHFYKKSHVWNKTKQKRNKINVYAQNNDYTQDRSSYQSRWGSDLKFNWKASMKSPNSRDKFEGEPNKNLTELNTSGWKITKDLPDKNNKSPDWYTNKVKPFVRNGLPPVVLKTAQYFYKNKPKVKDNPSDEFIRIEKPSHYKKSANLGVDNSHGSASYLFEQHDDSTVSIGLQTQIDCWSPI